MLYIYDKSYVTIEIRLNRIVGKVNIMRWKHFHLTIINDIDYRPKKCVWTKKLIINYSVWVDNNSSKNNESKGVILN